MNWIANKDTIIYDSDFNYNLNIKLISGYIIVSSV